MQIIKVLIPKTNLFPLNYSTKKNYNVGSLIVVPFRNTKITGIVWQTACSTSTKILKTVSETSLFNAKISNKIIELIKKTSNYYLTDLGTIAKLVLPVDINSAPIKIKEQKIISDIVLPPLSKNQQMILSLIGSYQKPVVIKGVTGSGKTEVYFHAVMQQLNEGKQALVMLPEISLSVQIISRFSQRFGFEPTIWNSKITKAQKKQILRGIISANIKVVIGARSALFLPYKKLGIIVVDEEHDSSYKQEEGILYNARDMAVLRGNIEKCKVLLASATPSIETLHNTKIGKYHLVELKNRYNKAYMPIVKIIDMKQESLNKDSWLSEEVVNSIEYNLKNNQQALLFLNRRGYAPLVICKLCGYRANCKFCTAFMVMHKITNRLECHHCGSILPIHKSCPECDSKNSLTLCGPGVERIAEEVKQRFPENKVAIISKDQVTATSDIQELLYKMEIGEIGILIGTQIVTKGYHFPNLTLVVIIDADIGFVGGDLRASERTFQLLHQVGGRAGRENKKGLVLIQTYYPKHKVIVALANGNEDSFIQEELKSRNAANMPPFTKTAVVTITGKNATKTLIEAKQFVFLAPKSSAKILGPAEALIHKLSGRYRYKILVIAEKNFNLQEYLKLWKNYSSIPSMYRLKIDIDPYNFV